MILLVCLLGYHPAGLAWQMEARSITLPSTFAAGFTTINFTQTYATAPLVFATPTTQGGDPNAIRIRNVTTTSFEITNPEPSSEDGPHVGMDIYYLAIDAGSHLLPNGLRIEAGLVNTQKVQLSNVVAGTASWETLSFSPAFPATPIVLAQIQTMANETSTPPSQPSIPWLTVAMNNASAASVDIALERSEVNDGVVTQNESVAYLAIENGQSGSFTDKNGFSVNYETLLSANTIDGWDDGCDNVNFTTSFTGIPVVFAHQATRSDTDGGWIRRCALSASAIGLTIDEDQDADTERAHSAERANILAFSGNFAYDSTATPPPPPSFDEFWKLEVDSVVLPAVASGSVNFTTVTLRQTYNNTPLVFVLQGIENNQPQAIRIRNVSKTSFEMAQVETPGEDGIQPQTTVHYLAVEPGLHLIPGAVSGTQFKIEAGSIATTAFQTKLLPGTSSWESINLGALFGATPVVLAQVQTMANESGAPPGAPSEPWLTTAMQNVTNSGFQLALERAEVTNGTVVNDETIAYLAIETGATGVFTDNSGFDISYETILSNDAINGVCAWGAWVWHFCLPIFYNNTYSTPPLVIATQNRRDDADGGWVRRCSVTNTFVRLVIEEDETNDAERWRSTESAGMAIFSQAFDAFFTAPNPIILSTKDTATLGGLTFDEYDLAKYDPATDTALQYFDGASLLNKQENINAVSILPNGHLILSFDKDVTIGGLDVTKGDLADYDPLSDVATLLFDGNLFSKKEDIDAVHVYENGLILMSTKGDATLGGLNFSPDDLALYDPVADNATLFFDGAVEFSANKNIDAVHILNNGNIVLSTDKDAVLGGVPFGKGDLIEYNKTTKSAKIYFDNGLFTANEDINAATIDQSIPIDIDHFEISHSGNGITCEAEPITISAHDSSHNIITGFTDTINITTSANTGDWSINTGAGTLVNSGSGAASYSFVSADNGQIILDFAHPTPAANLSINLTDGTHSEDVSEDPPITFEDTGLRFYADGSANVLGPHTAGKDSNLAPDLQTLTLRAVKTNTDTMACEALIQGTRTVQMAFECNNPTSCQAGQTTTITPSGQSSVSIAGNNNGSVATYSNTTVDFDATGTATFVANYSDAGQITLHAQTTLPATPPNPTLTLSGNSNPITFKPAGLCVYSPDANSDCAAGDQSCSGFTAAGNPFNLNIKGVAWQSAGETNADFCTGNSTTPNYQQTNLSVNFTEIAPNLGATVTIGQTAFDLAAADNGEHSINNQTVSEVGVFTFTATPPANTYFGESIAASTSANIGRFYPARLDVVASTPAFRNGPSPAWTCPFTYMDQNFTLDTPATYTITGKNSVGLTTANYDSAFWNLGSGLTGRSYISTATSSATLSSLNSGTITVSDANNGDGDRVFSLAGDTLVYQRNPAAEASFSAAATLRLSAGDLTDSDGACYDSNGDTSCDLLDITGITGTQLRFGRGYVNNAYGSELADLDIPLRTEYYDGTSFIKNIDDSCSAYNSTTITLSIYTNNLNSGETAGSGAGTFNAGGHDPTNPIQLSAPGNGNDGSVSVTLGLDAWLQFDWDNDTNHDNDPSGIATFGLFQGSDQQIFIQEVLPPAQ